MTGKRAGTAVSRQQLVQGALADLQAGRWEQAVSKCTALTQAEPANFTSWMNLGTALRRLGHLDAAIIAGRRAVALAPDSTACLTNLGNALLDASHVQEALELQRRAQALSPSDTLLRRNLAVALREAGAFAQAHELFQALAQQAPEDPELQWEQALCLLYSGDYTRGWPAFESRWGLKAMAPRRLPLPMWQGEDMAGRHLLITEEQGFGDTLLCSRYLPRVVAMAGRVTLACKKPLHHLLSGIEGLTLITTEEISPESGRYDAYTAMMSLPGIFKTDLASIPAPAPLVAAATLPPVITQALRAGAGRLRVGVIWSGSVTFGNNRKRSVTAERFLPLAAIDGVQLYSLQKGPREHELRPFGGQAVIAEIGPHLEDFAQTAAVLRQLDLVIMTDSSVAHLAGTLGVPVWNLLHDRPYWLYLSERRDCPWYPSMTLYRQQSPGDWDGLFATVAADLTRLANQKR